MRSITIIILSLGLAGCSQMTRLRTDLSAPAPATGLEVMALRNNLAIAFEEKDVNQPGTIGCTERKRDKNKPGKKCVMFRQDGTPEEVAGYLSSAFALTNSLCDDFFRTTNTAALHRQNLRANVNDVGTLISAILGFAKAGSIATSAVASATGFSDSIVRNYDSAYLVTPDLATLQSLVRAEQVKVRKEIMQSPPTTFEAARDATLFYAEPCSYLGMKRLLTNSVQLQTIVTREGVENSIAVARITAKTDVPAAVSPTQSPDSPPPLSAVPPAPIADAISQAQKGGL